jgi:hypothetical protein
MNTSLDPKAFSAAREVAAGHGVSARVGQQIVEAYLQGLEEKRVSDFEIRSLLLEAGRLPSHDAGSFQNLL